MAACSVLSFDDLCFVMVSPVICDEKKFCGRCDVSFFYSDQYYIYLFIGQLDSDWSIPEYSSVCSF